MTRYAPLWEQADSYPASLDRQLIDAAFPPLGIGGYLMRNGTTWSGSACWSPVGTLSVNVPAASAVVALQASQGKTLCLWDAVETVALASGSPQPRIDLVYLQVRDAAYDGGGNNDFVFLVAQGAPAGSPTVPAVPNNAQAMCQVLVPASAANLNAATFTDRRIPINPRDLYHARMSRAAAWAIPNVLTAVPFDTTTRDPTGLWVAAQTAFVTPLAGLWLVQAVIDAGAATTLGVAIQQNGTTVIAESAPIAAPGGTLSVNAVCATAAGDRLSVAASSSIAANTANGAPYNTVLIDYLGTG
jgi:hypothetical protein